MSHSFDDPIRREIWATVRAMNDAWTKGDPATLAEFFHRDMVAINPVDRLRLAGRAACVAGWEGFCKVAEIEHWEEREPLIHVYGEAAVVAYYYEIRFVTGGRTIETGGRDLFFFVREQGRWWAVADQFSSFPV